MSVHFKFKSAKNADSVSIDGLFISVRKLKDKIVEKKRMMRGDDLVISNAQTDEKYEDDFMVPKNSSVLVRRVARPSLPIIVTDEQIPSLEVRPVNSVAKTFESSQKTNLRVTHALKSFASSQKDSLHVNNTVKTFELSQNNSLRSSDLDKVDDLGFDLYAVPEVVPAPRPALSDENEDEKIRAILEASSNDWQKQLQGIPSDKRYAKNGQRGEHGREPQNTVPHHGYVCHRCRVPGHFIQHCPTNGVPEYDKKGFRPPTGIPKTMLIPDAEGTYFLPTGQVAVLKPNEAVFEREVDFLPSLVRKTVDIPPELCCPLCKEVLKDAVLTSKCCFMSYCDKCIRDQIISKAKCVCGATSILADDLLPNRTLRVAIKRLMESQSAFSTSSGNVSTITSSGNAGPQASAVAGPKSKSFDSKKPLAGGKDGVRQGQKPQLSVVLNRFTRPDVELGDTSESQLMESVEDEVVSSRRPPNLDRKRKGLFDSHPTNDFGDKRIRAGFISTGKA